MEGNLYIDVAWAVYNNIALGFGNVSQLEGTWETQCRWWIESGLSDATYTEWATMSLTLTLAGIAAPDGWPAISERQCLGWRGAQYRWWINNWIISGILDSTSNERTTDYFACRRWGDGDWVKEEPNRGDGLKISSEMKVAPRLLIKIGTLMDWLKLEHWWDL